MAKRRTAPACKDVLTLIDDVPNNRRIGFVTLLNKAQQAEFKVVKAKWLAGEYRTKPLQGIADALSKHWGFRVTRESLRHALET